MKRKRFSVEQIVRILKQAEVGAGGGSDSQSGHRQPDLLSMEEAVRRAGGGSGHDRARTQLEALELGSYSAIGF